MSVRGGTVFCAISPRFLSPTIGGRAFRRPARGRPLRRRSRRGDRRLRPLLRLADRRTLLGVREDGVRFVQEGGLAACPLPQACREVRRSQIIGQLPVTSLQLLLARVLADAQEREVGPRLFHLTPSFSLP